MKFTIVGDKCVINLYQNKNTKNGRKKMGESALRGNDRMCIIKTEYSEKIFIRICHLAETLTMSRNW